MLIASYFSDRKQLVKIGNHKGEWNTISSGAQGSIFWVFYVYVFQNDLALKLEHMCNIYNYADDKTMGCRTLTKGELCDSIMNVSKTMISWCNAN